MTEQEADDRVNAFVSRARTTLHPYFATLEHRIHRDCPWWDARQVALAAAVTFVVETAPAIKKDLDLTPKPKRS